MQSWTVLGQPCIFVRLLLFYKDTRYILAAFCPRCTLFLTLGLWLRLSTPMTRSVRPSRWCMRQMAPPTRPWMVLSIRWCTSILWKPHRHVKRSCLQCVYSSVNSPMTYVYSLPVTVLGVVMQDMTQGRFVLFRSL